MEEAQSSVHHMVHEGTSHNTQLQIFSPKVRSGPVPSNAAVLITDLSTCSLMCIRFTIKGWLKLKAAAFACVFPRKSCICKSCNITTN